MLGDVESDPFDVTLTEINLVFFSELNAFGIRLKYKRIDLPA